MGRSRSRRRHRGSPRPSSPPVHRTAPPTPAGPEPPTTPEHAEKGEDDLYEVDCTNIESDGKTGEAPRIESRDDQEVVAEKINVGETERIVIFRKMRQTRCTRYILKDMFD